MNFITIEMDYLECIIDITFLDQHNNLIDIVIENYSINTATTDNVVSS